MERHATLRSAFRLEGREVLQIIHLPAAVPLQAEPLGDREAQEVIDQWLAQEQATPFDLVDLAEGLLLRGRLLQVAPDEHLLLLNHHHIASDGWSTAVLAGDLVALYSAHLAGRTPR